MSHIEREDTMPSGYGGDAYHQPRQAPTSAEIDAVIAAAIANAPPAPPPLDVGMDTSTRSLTPLMTNILPSAIGSDGRVNLFIGNLPYRVRWQDLKDLFRKAGTVLRADVSLGPDNRSRGYGNVVMGSREDAARAIDRFNGFTWQTRTLEVRPDRLPQEYEPQPHVHHKQMYGGFQPMQHHFGGGGGGWLGRPPHGGFGFPPHLGPHGGPSPMGFRPPPIAGHAIGSTIPPVGASVLAGSLTAGGGSNPGWREGLAPFPAEGASVRSASPAHSVPQVTVDAPRPHSPGRLLDQAEALGRVPPHTNRTPNLLPASMSPEFESSAAKRRPSSSSDSTPPVLVPPPIPLNGLANQAKDLGAPNTLYDRVVFVKNLPFTTQWQDLKDLFRPAGAVIRADVATGPDGQSRGFGTVLFAAKEDARRAVGMFHGHEVDGRVLNVQTERQTLEDKQIQPIHPVESFGSFELPSPPSWSNTPAPVLDVTGSPTDSFTGSSANQSPGALRVPWQLNTGVPNTSNVRPNLQQQKNKHPGPISLPPFPSPSEINPLSPLQTRNLPPMTPSMPGFVFNAHPQTPPAHAQFLSPGGGPFSPGLPVQRSKVGGKSPFINAAPGAPVRPAGSAALGTPTTEVKSNRQSQLAGEYFPNMEADELVESAAGLTIAEDSAGEAAAAGAASSASASSNAKTTTNNSTNGRGKPRSWSKVARGE